jgi:predicted PurR-regulated permease PerM
MISISVPGIAKVIQSALLGFICMDLLYTDRWLNPLIFKDQTSSINDDDKNLEEEKALNDFFEENGFSTKILIKNLGSTFVYLILYLLILIFLPLLKIFAKY